MRGCPKWNEMAAESTINRSIESTNPKNPPPQQQQYDPTAGEGRCFAQTNPMCARPGYASATAALFRGLLTLDGLPIGACVRWLGRTCLMMLSDDVHPSIKQQACLPTLQSKNHKSRDPPHGATRGRGPSPPFRPTRPRPRPRPRRGSRRKGRSRGQERFQQQWWWSKGVGGGGTAAAAGGQEGEGEGAASFRLAGTTLFALGLFGVAMLTSDVGHTL